jgi:predicted ATPase
MRKRSDMPEIFGLPLRSLEMHPWPERLSGQFPFTIPVVKSMGRLDFHSPVTFFVGENGSGKSTVLEGLACAIGSVTVGSEGVLEDRGLSGVRELAQYMRLIWTKRTRKGFFLRAEDFFGYARRMAKIKEELNSDLSEVDDSYKDRSELAKGLAKMPYESELSGIKRRYGEGLDSQSHGESFLLLFQQRFTPGGLYLLDEPEAPLSPVRQLGLLALIKQMIEQQAQFVIATHSPILMAFPGAEVLSFDGGRIAPVVYEELEHVRLTRDFLNNPEAFLRHL